MSAPLPWDEFLHRRRVAAVQHIQRRLGVIASLPEADRSDPRMMAIRHNLASRLRRLKAQVGG
jgi:hypothetical protein